MADGPARITQPTLDVLVALLDADDCEIHGWQLMRATGRAGPTVYKILERLDAAGWLAARWAEESKPGVPRRRYYRFTERGAAGAREILAGRRSTSGA